ncbi:VOC family protein [bacterium]|nr:VOC family protein [candidate division CSSED10-310 bacterium]
MKRNIDHIGILVSNLERSLLSIRLQGWPIGEIEEFPSEGTKEVYVGSVGASGRLLLLEAIGDGPYRDAMVKRGSGLHHIALNVSDVFAFLDRVSGSGWYLYPKSLATHRHFKTIWLTRPGVPILVEVVERISPDAAEREIGAFVSRIEVPMPDDKPHMVDSLGVGEAIQKSPNQDVFITIAENRLALQEFIAIAD